MEKLCLFCQTAVKGRSDKKFCDHQCRASYHHHHKGEPAGMFISINRVLKKNRDVLLKLNPRGKTKVSRSKLLSAGFDLNFHTHSHTTAKGSTYFFCYEYGYLPLINDRFLLIKKADKL